MSGALKDEIFSSSLILFSFALPFLASDTQEERGREGGSQGGREGGTHLVYV